MQAGWRGLLDIALRFKGGHCVSAVRQLSMFISTVIDTLLHHTRCGVENSASYVQSGQALALV
jgi:hypothetical protein